MVSASVLSRVFISRHRDLLSGGGVNLSPIEHHGWKLLQVALSYLPVTFKKLQVMKSTLRIARQFEVSIDSSYAALVIGVVVLVGFATSMDPAVNLMDAAAPAFLQSNLLGKVSGRLYTWFLPRTGLKNNSARIKTPSSSTEILRGLLGGFLEITIHEWGSCRHITLWPYKNLDRTSTRDTANSCPLQWYWSEWCDWLKEQLKYAVAWLLRRSQALDIQMSWSSAKDGRSQTVWRELMPLKQSLRFAFTGPAETSI